LELVCSKNLAVAAGVQGNGVFLDVVFSNLSFDVALETSLALLFIAISP
jgi:hypothetical protein